MNGNSLAPNENFDWNESYKNAPSRQNSAWDYMATRNPNIKNRFNDYEHQFDFDSIEKELSKIYGGYEDIINRDAAELTTGQQKGASSRFASRGITGGSIIDDTMGGIASNINKSKSNALTKLGIGEADAKTGFMDLFNKYKMQTTKMGSDVDAGNALREFMKGKQMGGYDVAWQEQDRANEMMPGWLEDLMAFVGDAAGFIPGFGDLSSGIMDMFSGGSGGANSTRANPGR